MIRANLHWPFDSRPFGTSDPSSASRLAGGWTLDSWRTLVRPNLPCGKTARRLSWFKPAVAWHTGRIPVALLLHGNQSRSGDPFEIPPTEWDSSPSRGTGRS